MQDMTVNGNAGSGTTPDDLQALARLADALVEQVGEARAQFEQLSVMLSGSGEDALAGIPATFDEADLDDGPEALQERVRLDALNLALTGQGREAARDQLLELFSEAAVDDIDEALDSAFGTEAGALGRGAPRERLFSRFRH